MKGATGAQAARWDIPFRDATDSIHFVVDGTVSKGTCEILETFARKQMAKTLSKDVMQETTLGVVSKHRSEASLKGLTDKQQAAVLKAREEVHERVQDDVDHDMMSLEGHHRVALMNFRKSGMLLPFGVGTKAPSEFQKVNR